MHSQQNNVYTSHVCDYGVCGTYRFLPRFGAGEEVRPAARLAAVPGRVPSVAAVVGRDSESASSPASAAAAGSCARFSFSTSIGSA